MQFFRSTRTWRVLGAAVLVGALATGPLAGAAAAKTDFETSASRASGFALRAVVDLTALPDDVRDQIQSAYATVRGALPAEAKSLLPAQFPFVIDQRFMETLSEVGDVTQAQALFGSGSDSSARATSVGQTDKVVTATHKLPSAELPVLNASVGELLASVKSGPRATSDATLVQVTASLEFVKDLMPAELQTVFDDALAQINGAIDTVNGELDTAVGEVAGAYDEVEALTDPILGPVLGDADLKEIVTDATELANQVSIPSLSDPLGAPLATIKGLDNDADAQQTADKVVADASSQLASINVLDLIKVGVVSIKSHSEAAGTEGSAMNSKSCDIADVRLSHNGTGVSLDGKNLYVNGKAVPVPLADIAGIKNTVDGVLNVAGLKVDLCDAAVSQAAADGTSASQTVSALHIEWAPTAPIDVPALGIGAGDQLLKVIIDPSVETAVAARVGQPAKPILPRTGAATLATVLSGIGLAGGALFLRRRLA